MNSQTKSKSGFTIIEVVLVLAIAGLIFLIVFLAVPALQRSQRDTQRKSDLGRLTSAISNYQSNNKGAVPTTSGELSTLVTNYVRVNGDSFADPGGTNYSVTLSDSTTYTSAVPTNTIYYYTGATCSGEDAAAATGARKFAVRVDLEGGGTYCQNN
jgi:prepilin-type N-terminal cleavage/methylation domain-containing protein